MKYIIHRLTMGRGTKLIEIYYRIAIYIKDIFIIRKIVDKTVYSSMKTVSVMVRSFSSKFEILGKW